MFNLASSSVPTGGNGLRPIRDAGAAPCPPGSDVSAEARGWITMSVGSLLIAGILSLWVVLGRLPVISHRIADPLFFKRCLVVHVNLAIVLWFYAFLCGLVSLRLPAGSGRRGRLALGIAWAGTLAILTGALARGAQPVLSNYIPVIDHPLFLGGLALFFSGVALHTWGTIFSTSPTRSADLPEDAVPGLQAAAVALAVAAATWVSTVAGLPAGLERKTYFEFSFWGAGHALQVANACAMLAVWQWLLASGTGRSPWSVRAARRLYAALLLPHLFLPLLCWRGPLHSPYVEGATLLMRWGIFPVVLVFLVTGARHLHQHAEECGRSDRSRCLRTALHASFLLTLLGFVLGAMIRGSTTLVPAHYHAALGAVTVAFMAGAYLVADAQARQSGRVGMAGWGAARAQLILFGIGQAVFAGGFGIGGAYGLGRKTYAAEQHVRGLGEIVGLSVMGVGGLVVTAAGVWFLVRLSREIRLWGKPFQPQQTTTPNPRMP